MILSFESLYKRHITLGVAIDINSFWFNWLFSAKNPTISNKTSFD